MQPCNHARCMLMQHRPCTEPSSSGHQPQAITGRRWPLSMRVMAVCHAVRCSMICTTHSFARSASAWHGTESRARPSYARSFGTSWRLSLLAFVTLAPVIYITRLYAAWSRRLNQVPWRRCHRRAALTSLPPLSAAATKPALDRRSLQEIYACLGEANSVAQEALGNIRTVRTFSSEPTEIKRYAQTTQNVRKRRGCNAGQHAAGTRRTHRTHSSAASRMRSPEPPPSR